MMMMERLGEWWEKRGNSAAKPVNIDAEDIRVYTTAVMFCKDVLHGVQPRAKELCSHPAELSTYTNLYYACHELTTLTW